MFTYDTLTLNTFNAQKDLTENTCLLYTSDAADEEDSVDYSSNGETLISSSDDDSIIIYDCQNGT